MLETVRRHSGPAESEDARSITHEIVSAALDRVNDIRGEHGLGVIAGLPLGDPDNAVSCPIARALTEQDITAEVSSNHSGCEVGVYHGEDHVTDYTQEAEIGRFVEMFDDGALPQYELHPREWDA